MPCCRCSCWSVTEGEALKILATLDPLAAMATADAGKLDSLMLGGPGRKHGIVPGNEAAGSRPSLGQKFEIVITCESEAQQQELFEQFSQEGLKCRVLTF